MYLIIISPRSYKKIPVVNRLLCSRHCQPIDIRLLTMKSVAHKPLGKKSANYEVDLIDLITISFDFSYVLN